MFCVLRRIGIISVVVSQWNEYQYRTNINVDFNWLIDWLIDNSLETTYLGMCQGVFILDAYER